MTLILISHLEKHLKKVYNIYMIDDLGLLSAYSTYAINSANVYKSGQITPVQDEQELGAGKISTDNPLTGEINDEAIISDKAMSLLAAEQGASLEGQAQKDSDLNEENSNKKPQTQKEELTPEQKQEVAELKARDAEVKAHEQAHMAAASGINASAPSYDYQTGPDGRKYAVGGEVAISFNQSSDPEENIKNAETMKAAALAPAQPSSQDLSVARNADKMIAEAKQELSEQKTEELKSADEDEQTNAPAEPEITEEPELLENKGGESGEKTD